MTYLEAVNKVLLKLRENTVSSVTETPYAQLIGEFVNDVKKDVEDAWNWEALRAVKTVTTVNGTSSYTITGTNERTRVFSVWNDTDDWWLNERGRVWFTKHLNSANPANGFPNYYGFNGIDSNRALKVDVYPVPDQEYILKFDCVVPQADLSANADIITVPGHIVVEGAIARAISERGDDGGFSEQELRYRSRLSDAIAIEVGRHSNEVLWGAV